MKKFLQKHHFSNSLIRSIYACSQLRNKRSSSLWTAHVNIVYCHFHMRRCLLWAHASYSYTLTRLSLYIYTKLHHTPNSSHIYLRPGTGHGTSAASAYRQDDSLQEQPLLQLPLSSPPTTLSSPPRKSSSSSSSSHQPRSRRHCSEGKRDKNVLL